jgi:hypothetical protein
MPMILMTRTIKEISKKQEKEYQKKIKENKLKVLFDCI